MGRKSNLLNEYRELRERYMMGDLSVTDRLENLSIILNVNDNYIDFGAVQAQEYIGASHELSL